MDDHVYIYLHEKYIYLVIDVDLENNIFVKTIILFLSDLGWCEKQYIENIHILILFGVLVRNNIWNALILFFKYLIVLIDFEIVDMVLWWFEMHLFLYTWLECMVQKGTGPEGDHGDWVKNKPKSDRALVCHIVLV